MFHLILKNYSKKKKRAMPTKETVMPAEALDPARKALVIRPAAHTPRAKKGSEIANQLINLMKKVSAVITCWLLTR